MNLATIKTAPPHFTLDELVLLAPHSPVAAFALRLHLALAVIAQGGDRLKLQAIAQDNLRPPEPRA